MMRALLRLAAALLAAAACGPNPAFKIAGGRDDITTTTATSGDEPDDSSSGSPQLPCEAAPVEPVDDVCDPWRPFVGAEPPNLALTSLLGDVPCGEVSDITIKRVTDTLVQQCDEGCQTCDPARFFSVDIITNLAYIAPHIPPRDVCTRLWHIARPTPETPNEACKSVAYAFWDDDGDAQQLRLAYASGSLNPFAGVEGLPLTIKSAGSEACGAGEVLDFCEVGAKVEDLAVEVPGCAFTATQGETWQRVPLGGLEYLFDFRAFACVAGVTTRQVSWYLRRAQP